MVVLRLWIMSSFNVADKLGTARGVMRTSTLRRSSVACERPDVPERFQAIHQPGRGGGGVAHPRGDLGHRQGLALVERAEQERIARTTRCRAKARTTGSFKKQRWR